MIHVHNYVGLDRFTVSSPYPVPAGRHSIRYEFKPNGAPDFTRGRGSPGRGQLYFDQTLVAAIDLPYTTPNTFGVLGLSCGYAAFDSVDPNLYAAPFRFTGTIERVTIDVSGQLIQDPDAEITRLITQQ